MKKRFTIEDLSKERCAVINDGTLEEFIEVMELAFPSEPRANIIRSTDMYYYKCMDMIFGTNYNPKQPTQSVKDFLSKELKRGDLVWVSDECPNERNEQRIYLANIEGSKYPIIAVAQVSTNDFRAGEIFDTSRYVYATKVEEPKEVVMTIQDIEKALGVTNLKIVK